MVSSENGMIYQGWIRQAWRKEDAQQEIIQLQKYVIYILIGICLLMCLGWMSAPSRLTVYIPPDLQNGVTQKAGAIPNALIYSFTYEVWQELNYWSQDGEADYPKNILTYQYYLTQAFQAELKQEY